MINVNALSRIKEKIYNSILVNNIPNHNVDIIAVTKTFPKEAIVSGGHVFKKKLVRAVTAILKLRKLKCIKKQEF